MQSPIPGLVHSLNALKAILAKAEAHCVEKKIDPSVLMQDRLFPDMLPLWRQVTIACDNAKGAAARLGGVENPSHPDTETTFEELRARIDKTVAFMQSVPAENFEGAETRPIVMKFGPREVNFTGASYLSSYLMPNFYFHMTTAYNILRHDGVVLGKGDFLGG
ncbi:MAG: DUF1993 family protein [Limimaricola sp.]|uniref:DUF1993 domain-containing protein n=1 Tax=Limimaricola sp. TaxID=2211665 RepID=UPI001D3EBA34|nr:DUF1993 domain-containing protein [Limimaricola sp.]MBI1415869.1 DUF1993 family protein [Limimaricola sp.]